VGDEDFHRLMSSNDSEASKDSKVVPNLPVGGEGLGPANSFVNSFLPILNAVPQLLPALIKGAKRPGAQREERDPRDGEHLREADPVQERELQGSGQRHELEAPQAPEELRNT
jgi:hypothetical protein